jgi:hypothetical protein
MNASLRGGSVRRFFRRRKWPKETEWLAGHGGFELAYVTFEIGKASAFANVGRSISAIPAFELPWDCHVNHTANVRNWRARRDLNSRPPDS